MNIKFTRGDTFKFKFQRKNLNNDTILEKSEKMWFTVKKNYKTKDIAIQKTLKDNTIIFDDDGYYHVTLNNSDTKDLKYQKYVYDIQIANNGIVKTIAFGTLELTNEVTFESGD